MLEKFCPIFPSRDIDATESFYARLGFRTVYKSEEIDYLLLKRDLAEVHSQLDLELDPVANDHAGFMRPEDVDAFSREIAGLGLPSEGVPRFEHAQDQPWGMRELTIVDPDGNLIRAAQEIPLG
jgi:catechol 2,3-dioxygenase-like lactoylglutathione lyase family enzyme